MIKTESRMATNKRGRVSRKEEENRRVRRKYEIETDKIIANNIRKVGDNNEDENKFNQIFTQKYNSSPKITQISLKNLNTINFPENITETANKINEDKEGKNEEESNKGKNEEKKNDEEQKKEERSEETI